MYCPNCGSKNKEDSQFCESCGTKLDEFGATTGTQQVPPSQKAYNQGEVNKPSTVLVVLGYIFALLGGLIGIVIGLFLYSKDNHAAKSHGRNMLIIATVVIVLGLLVNVFVLSSDLTQTTTPSVSSNGLSSSSSSSSSDSSSSGSSTSAVKLVISYSGDWTGAISDSSGTRTIEGTGDKTINLGNIDGAVAANAQKSDDSSETMTISLKKGVSTLKKSSTSSEYGFVSVSDYIE